MRGSDSLYTCVATRVAVRVESDYDPIAARYRSDACNEMEPRYSCNLHSNVKISIARVRAVYTWGAPESGRAPNANSAIISLA